MNKYNDLRQNLQVFDFALNMRKQTFDRIAEGHYDSFNRWLKTNFMLAKKDHNDWQLDVKKHAEKRRLHSFTDMDRGVILAIFDQDITLVHSSATLGRLAGDRSDDLDEYRVKGQTCSNQFNYTVTPYQPMLVNLNMAHGVMKHPKPWQMVSLRLDWTMREWLEYILSMGQQQQ